MRIIPALLIAFTLGSIVAPAQKRPMTFEDLQKMKRVSDPQISPSGKWVMFSVMDVDLDKNSKVNHLWAVPTDGTSKEFQLTTGDGESSGRFSPDGTRFVFVTRGQLYLSAWNDKTGAMSPAVPLTHIFTEADAPLWSPDGQSLAFVTELYPTCAATALYDDACNRKADDEFTHAPTKALIFDHLLYRHWNTYQGPKRSHIMMLHVANAGKVFDLTPTSDWSENTIAPPFAMGGSLGYAFSPDSKELAFVLNNDKVPAASTNNDIYTIDVTQHSETSGDATTGWSPKKISTSPGSDDAPAYSPDGKFLAFRSQARAGYESDRFRLMLYDREKKIAVEFPSSNAGVDEFLWSRNSHYIFSVSAQHGAELIARQTINPRPPTATENGELIDMRISGRGEFSNLSLTLDGKSVIAAGMTASSPTEIMRFASDIQCHSLYGDVGGQEYKRPELDNLCGDPSKPTWTDRDPGVPITKVNNAIVSSLALAPMETFFFHGAGGTEVQGFLIRPPNFDPSKKYPLKFLIHGGPQGAWGDAWSYRWNAELLAANGYVVVMINPRGSTGYGQAFVDGVNGDWGGKPYIDLMRGLDFAETKFPFIDKSRECALGASYGGFMANWILTHTNRFACIVSHDGMFNPQSAYGTTEELWFNEWEFRKSGSSEPAQPWKYAAGPADADPFRKWSPMLAIANAKTPTLVIHSQRDYRLDVSEGFQLFTALQRLNVPSKMLYFPDEGHWVMKPQNSKLWYETVNDWCDQWTHTNKYAKQ